MNIETQIKRMLLRPTPGAVVALLRDRLARSLLLARNAGAEDVY
jgi:hypothetical protein